MFATSKAVADKLEARHNDLLKTIASLVSQGDLTHREGYGGNRTVLVDNISGAKFIKDTFVNKQGRAYDMWNMNEQGFIFLVMQLGRYKKAKYIQKLFIKAFTQMKDALRNQQNASWIAERKETKVIRREQTDVIKELVEYATLQGSKSAKFYYSNITKMTNKALELLIQVEGGKPIRDLASVIELGFISVVDNRARQAIEEGMKRELPYKEVYRFAKEEVNFLVNALSFKKIENNE